jgi:adenosine deaminase
MDVHALPKVELHCHMDGLLDPPMLAEIRAAQPDYPLSETEFQRAYPIFDYDSFWRWWSFTDGIDGVMAYHLPILAIHLERLKAQNVCYTEIMVASGELPPDPAAAVDTMQAVREYVSRYEDERFHVEFLFCFGRNSPLASITAKLQRLKILHHAGLMCGIAVAGPEEGYPVKPFSHLLRELHDLGVNIEVHAGEWCGPESVWDALEYGYAQRIGHAVSAFEDPSLLAAIQERNIHLEMCPTSNLKTGSISDLRDHPIRKALALGLSFSVNTDDPGPFECSLESEYALLERELGFSESDFHHILHNSLQARFGKRPLPGIVACTLY